MPSKSSLLCPALLLGSPSALVSFHEVWGFQDLVQVALDPVGLFGGLTKLETSQPGRRGRHKASGPETIERILGFEPFPPGLLAEGTPSLVLTGPAQAGCDRATAPVRPAQGVERNRVALVCVAASPARVAGQRLLGKSHLSRKGPQYQGPAGKQPLPPQGPTDHLPAVLPLDLLFELGPGAGELISIPKTHQGLEVLGDDGPHRVLHKESPISSATSTLPVLTRPAMEGLQPDRLESLGALSCRKLGHSWKKPGW